MAVGIGASGVLGVAQELTINTYVPPAKFIPFLTESLQKTDDQQWRRPIRASADAIGVIGGNTQVAGDITIECEEDQLVYFLRAGRTNMVKTGTTPNWVYTFTPNATAQPAKTLSITIVRNGIVFGYVGCTTQQFSITVSGGILQATLSIIGSDEATQSLPTATWPATTPFGMGMYTLQIPTSSQVFDADTFTLTVNDNGAAQFRLNNTTRAAQYVAFGEREVTFTVDRDFLDKTEYSQFTALTAKSITAIATKGANNLISIVLPVATQTEYPINNSAQGDLDRVTENYTASIDGTGNSYTIVCNTQETIV